MDWTCSEIDQARTVKNIPENKLEGRLKIRFRWLEDVEKNLWEMKVKRRRQKTVDKEERM
jgi:hypothetical protein